MAYEDTQWTSTPEWAHKSDGSGESYDKLSAHHQVSEPQWNDDMRPSEAMPEWAKDDGHSATDTKVKADPLWNPEWQCADCCKCSNLCNCCKLTACDKLMLSLFGCGLAVFGLAVLILAIGDKDSVEGAVIALVTGIVLSALTACFGFKCLHWCNCGKEDSEKDHKDYRKAKGNSR